MNELLFHNIGVFLKQLPHKIVVVVHKISHAIAKYTSELIDKIANAANGHEKEYIVTLNLPVRQQFLKEIAAGIEI